ncbi:hypothetical protein ASD40_08595 [Paenibacillus sp. Root444D2]|nr:hypothetical protein ASD40_08595 [Paenibacillus sp. Root444D2]KRE52229.1 hypothetical protein ASG85_03635 [Paenibacillus sp. Soil724D2]
MTEGQPSIIKSKKKPTKTKELSTYKSLSSFFIQIFTIFKQLDLSHISILLGFFSMAKES